MRWSVFAGCAAAGLILQTTVAARTAIADVRPDWVFVLVVFFGLYAPRIDACLAGWVLGLGMDLLSVERLGLLATAYCVTAVIVNLIRDLVFLKHAGTHFVVTLVAALLLQAGLAGYRLLLYPNSVSGVGSVMGAGGAVA